MEGRSGRRERHASEVEDFKHPECFDGIGRHRSGVSLHGLYEHAGREPDISMTLDGNLLSAVKG
jgi:hypothetical protein